MNSASSKHSLTVVIDTNAEERERYEQYALHDLNYKPKKTVSVTLHNPKEPSDVRSSNFKVPLGHSTTFLVTPIVREIDESGRKLEESERNCRLDEDVENLGIYEVYTRAACIYECQMKHAIKKCGCAPWNYPHNATNETVNMFLC